MSWHIKFRWHYFWARIWRVLYKEYQKDNNPEWIKSKEKWRRHAIRAIEIAQKHINIKE